MKKYIVLSLLAAGLLCACTREAGAPEFSRGGKTVKAVLPGTKAFLGEKDGTAYPNYWAAGDMININGVASDPLDASFNGKSSAEFTIESATAPLNAVYPAAAVTEYAEGAAALSLPEVQNYVAGSYDPSAYIMTAHSEGDEALAFEPQMALFKFVASGEVNIKSVKLIASSEKKLSGPFGTDFSMFAPIDGATNAVTLNMPDGGVAPGTPMIMAIPAGDYTDGIGVVFTDVNDGVMARRATPSKPYEAGKMYSTEIDYEAAILFCTADVLTSSSIVLNWSSVNPEDNVNRAFDLLVYGDEACSNLLETYSIPANAACWNPGLKNWHLHFVIGGLSQGTQYWFKVKDKTDDSLSEACTATTTAFTPVAMPTSDISSTGVVFAEDFSEYAWGWERITQAGGYIPADQSSLSNHSTEGATFTREETAANSGMRSAAINTALSASRLDGWLSEGNTYYHPGYLKLGSDNDYGYVLTPKFPIAEDNEATVDVTLTASRYGDDEYETWMVCVISNDGDKGGRQSDFAWPDETDPDVYREVEFANIGAEWKTVTVEGLKIGRDNRLAFGRIKGGDKTKARVYLSEISVEVTALTETVPVLTAAEAGGKTSSTLVFEWDGKKDHPFTAALYSDAACQNVVSSFDLPAETTSIWNKTNPTYVFGGLTPNTTYYFKVSDTSYDPAVVSNVVAATTEEFDIVQMPASITGAGVVLAEDFGEILWNADMLAKATGFVPSSTSSFSDKDVAKFVAGNSNSDEKKWSNCTDALASSRLAGWAADSGVYFHCGNLKMGTTSGKGWILTPEFTVPEGKKATVKVTVTAARYNSSQATNWAIAVLNPTEAKVDGISANFSWPPFGAAEKYQEVDLSSTSWSTVTAEGLEVLPGDRITFGARNGSASNEGRVFVGDIKVEVTAIENSGVSVMALEETSSTVTIGWTLGGSFDDDKAKAWDIALYDNAACSGEAVRAFSFEANSTIWYSSTSPRFVFTGLAPDTTYYVKVSDGDGDESKAVEVKTKAFSVVTLPSSVSAPGVILAEDFSELCWNSDYINKAAGIDPASGDTGLTTQTPLDSADPYDPVRPAVWWQLFKQSALSSSRLARWVYDAGGSSSSYGVTKVSGTSDGRPVMVGPGYLQLGTMQASKTSGKFDCAKAWIMTPEIPVEEGKVATVEVTITAATPSSLTGEWAVFMVSDGVVKDSYWYSFNWCDVENPDLYQLVTLNDHFASYTRTIKVKSGERIGVGPKSGFSFSSWKATSESNAKKPIMMLSDITLNVTAIEDAE